MPEVSRFYGISIQIYFGDHPPPHFHAVYGGHKAIIAIDPLRVIGGQLPPRALKLVLEWAELRQQELVDAFTRALNFQDPGKIAPLD